MSVSKYINGSVKKIASIVSPAISLTNNLLAINEGTALDATQGKIINDKFGGITFGTNGDGTYGYYKADGSFSPFNEFKLLMHPDYIWKGSLTANQDITIPCGFKPNFMVMSYRSTSGTKTSGAVGVWDLIGRKVVAYWGADAEPFYSNLTAYNSGGVDTYNCSGFTLTRTSSNIIINKSSTMYAVVFLYK